MQITSDRYYDTVVNRPVQLPNAKPSDKISSTSVTIADQISNEELDQRMPGAFGKVAILSETLRTSYQTARNDYEIHQALNAAGFKTTVLRDITIAPQDDSPYDQDGFAKGVILTREEGLMLSSYNRKFLGHALISGETEALTSEENVSKYGHTNLLVPYDPDKNTIPEENYLDEGVARYEQLHSQIEALDMDAHFKRIIGSELDMAFEEYVQTAFHQAGLSAEEADAVSEDFAKAFRLSHNNAGLSVQESYLVALRKLNSVSPNLNKEWRYSSHHLDIAL